MEKSKVYFTSMKVNAGTNLLKKLNHLIKEAGIANIDFENKYTAIKIHFGEPWKPCISSSKLCKSCC